MLCDSLLPQEEKQGPRCLPLTTHSGFGHDAGADTVKLDPQKISEKLSEQLRGHPVRDIALPKGLCVTLGLDEGLSGTWGDFGDPLVAQTLVKNPLAMQGCRDRG